MSALLWMSLALLPIGSASAFGLTMSLCSVFTEPWAVQDNMGLYLALHYWRSGPRSLAGGLEKPENPVLFNVSVVELESGCSSTTAFASATSVFSPANPSVDVINGCICSAASLQVGRFSTAFQVPMMVTTSQSSLLSNKETDYPYVFRWCTTELADANTHASLLVALEVRSYTVIYRDNQKNNRAKEHLLENPGVKDLMAHVVRLDDFDLSVQENFNMASNHLRSVRLHTSWVLVTFLSSSSSSTPHLALHAAYDVGLFNNYSIALVEEPMIFLLDDATAAFIPPAIRATLVGSFVGRAKAVESRYQAWVSWMTSVPMDALRALGFSSPVADEAWLSHAPMLAAPWHAFRFDATVALLMVMQDLWSTGQKLNSSSIFDGVLHLPLKGLMGDVSWDANLDRQGLIYEILQLQYQNDSTPWPLSMVAVGEAVLTPDENGVTSADLNRSLLRFQNSGPGTLPRRELLYSEAPPCLAGWRKPDVYSTPEECTPCPQGTFSSEVTGQQCVHCQPGFYSDSEATTLCILCTPGNFANLSGATLCKQCRPGTATDLSGATECTQCEVGYVASSAGTAKCLPCAPGKYSMQIAAASCMECAPGSAQVASGSTACDPCQLGRYAREDGSRECVWCPENTFQNQTGASNCEDCSAVISGSSTIFRLGSESPEACLCEEGSFAFRGTPTDLLWCASCPIGVKCVGGNASLLQQAGYHAGPQAYVGALPDPIVMCANRRKCPADRELGLCPDHRRGRGCDECDLGFTESQDSSCSPCRSSIGFHVILIVLGVLLVVGGLTVYALMEVHVRRETLVTALLSSAIMLNTMQTVGVISQMSISWIEPMLTISKVADFFMLSVHSLKLGCMVATSNPATLYIASIFIFPFFVLVQSATFAMVHVLFPRVRVEVNRALNVVGLMLLIAYQSLALNALLPWQCQTNPDGTQSVLSFRSILCYEESSHTVMLIFSFIGVLVYVAGFLSVVTWAVLVYPQQVACPHGTRFLKQFSFLFGRFLPTRYYYGAVFLVRNLLVVVLPVLLVNEPHAQVMALACIVTSFGALECMLQPWRSRPANALAALLMVGLTMMVCSSSFLVDSTDTSKAEVVVQGFLLASFLAMFGVGVVMNLAFLGQAAFPRKPFGIFLCHHKGGAGVLARLFKLVLVERCSSRIFLDSDELDDLSLLFNVVAYQTRNLVVLLTQLTLARMWCAGEITTATRMNVHIVPIACDDYVPPSDDFILHLSTTWTDSAITELHSLGIELIHVQDSYRSFRERHVIPFDRRCRADQQERMIVEAVNKCTHVHISKAIDIVVWDSHTSTVSDFVLIGNTCDAEASCTSQVLRRLIIEGMQRSVVVVEGAADLPKKNQTWSHLVAILSRGVLEQSLFAHVLVAAHQREVGVLGVCADMSFQFPAYDYWQELHSRTELLDAPPGWTCSLAEDVTMAEIEHSYKTLFRTIAKVFSPQGSERVLKAEVADMARRLTSPQRRLATTDTTPTCSLDVSPKALLGLPTRSGDRSPVCLPPPTDAGEVLQALDWPSEGDSCEPTSPYSYV